MHKDIAKGVGGPIGFQKARLTGVVARKQRGAHNVKLEFVEEGEKVGSPAVGRDGLAVEFRNERAERFDGDFEPGAKTVVEITETDERAEALTIGGELPVLDEIKLGFGGAVAVGGDVVANVFEAALEEVTFRELEGDLVFDKNLADAIEVVQKVGRSLENRRMSSMITRQPLWAASGYSESNSASHLSCMMRIIAV